MSTSYQEILRDIEQAIAESSIPAQPKGVPAPTAIESEADALHRVLSTTPPPPPRRGIKPR